MDLFLAEHPIDPHRHLNDFFVKIRQEFAIIGVGQAGHQQKNQ
jgi:hypothetical protein